MTHEVDTEPPAAEPSPADPPQGRASGLWAFLREIAIVVVVALALSFLIKLFLIQAFWIPSESMENTLLVGDRVIVSKLTPGPFELKRGDIIVFEDSGHWVTAEPKPKRGPVRSAMASALMFVGLLPSDSGEHLIKRVIGLPGDTVECCDTQGRLMVNGQPIDEAVYLHPGAKPSGTEFTVKVPEGRLWVMGDNRQESADSRAHRDNGHDGTVPMTDVVGRAFVLVWPSDRFRWLSNPSSVFEDVPAPGQ